MKRHKSLYPLSHDHHHGLFEARLLSLADEQAGQDSPGALANRFIEFWESDLQRHFQQEEEIVLPVIEQYKSPDSAEVKETLRQHDEIRRLIAEVKGKLAQQAGIDAALLRQLGDALRDHIRYEENELFPVLEACVPEKVLWQINEQLTK
jgi:iron-sulfur cluster repair protein YtfE (RIC family)